MLLKYIIFNIIFFTTLFSQECAPYFAPATFYEEPEILDELLDQIDISKQQKEFDIVKKELYKYDPYEISNEINDDFGDFWSDIVDADSYEAYLVPEYTKFMYKNYYLSLKIYFYGLKGDATHLKATIIKYHFYNYTSEVNRYILCKKSQK